jgi:hypothetical protein
MHQVVQGINTKPEEKNTYQNRQGGAERDQNLRSHQLILGLSGNATKRFLRRSGSVLFARNIQNLRRPANQRPPLSKLR